MGAPRVQTAVMIFPYLSNRIYRQAYIFVVLLQLISTILSDNLLLKSTQRIVSRNQCPQGVYKHHRPDGGLLEGERHKGRFGALQYKAHLVYHRVLPFLWKGQLMGGIRRKAA